MITLRVFITHRHSKNAGNIIFDAAYEDWTGAIPRKGEFIEVSDSLREAYNIPKLNLAFVQDVIWNFQDRTMTVYADV